MLLARVLGAAVGRCTKAARCLSAVPERLIAESGSSKVSGFVWGPLKRRADKEWVAEQAAPKRSRKLMSQLMEEQRTKLFDGEPWRACTHFRSGDAIAVRYVYAKTQKNENLFRGICVGTKRNGYASGFWVRNVVAGEEVLAFFKAFSPLLKGVDVIRPQMIKARRNKLTYLEGKLAKFIKGKKM